MWAHLFQQEEIGSISSHLYVAEKTVYRILYLYLSTGDVNPRKQRSGPVRELSDCEELQLLDAIFENPGIYLDELQAIIQRVCCINISNQSINQSILNWTSEYPAVGVVCTIQVCMLKKFRVW